MRANAKLFSEAFTQTAKVINSRTPKEVFKYVHAVANGGRLTLTGANGELILQRSIPCEGDLPAVLLPVQVGEVAKLSSDWIDVTTAGESLVVATPTGKSKLQTRLAEEFPMPEPVEGEPIQIPESVWHAAGRFVAPCVGVSGSFSAMAGVCIAKTEGMVEFVGTDGRRLGLASSQSDVSMESAVVRPEVFGLIAGDVTARISPQMASFTTGDTTAWSRLVAGRFPAYGDAMSGAMEGADRSVTVDSASLLNAVKSVGVTTSEESEGVDFTIGNGEIKVETAASDKGESHATVPAATNGDACTFRLSHAFMVEFLRKAPTGESIQIDYGDSSGVMLSSGRARCLIMTMARG